MMEQKEKCGFRWATHSAESREVHPIRCSHRDPTADAAIGNVMREERWKKRQEEKRKNQIKGCMRKKPEGGDPHA